MDGIVVMGIIITVTIGTAIIVMGIGIVDLYGEEKIKITTAAISHGTIAQLAIDLALRRCMRRNV
jgi:hypothetical protein